MAAVWYRLLIVLLCCSCAARHSVITQRYPLASSVVAPAYSNLFFWAAHPAKPDASDSIPASLLPEPHDSLADVFFIHPTTYTGKKTGWNADVTDTALNKKTDFSSILYQASVFNQYCRVFAPRYRQAHLSAFYSTEAAAQAAFDTAYADVKAAFEFYLLYENRGRPIIIAGHSQGAKMCNRLLQEFFDGKPLQQQLVAAYVVGWPVPQNLFRQLPLCSTPQQTGCCCTWRTFRKGYVPDYVLKETPASWVTNPLSWRTDSSYAGRSLNNGSILRNFNRLHPQTTDAQIAHGVLWVNKPRFPGGVFLTLRNYHIADINLFYANLRQNVAQRIAAYLQQH